MLSFVYEANHKNYYKSYYRSSLYGHKGLIWYLFTIVSLIATNEMQSNHSLFLQKANNSNLNSLLSCKQRDKMYRAQE